MRDSQFLDDMRRKHEAGSSHKATAPYSETIALAAGTLTVEFTPDRPADVEAARRKMQGAIAASFASIPACQRYSEAASGYQNAQKDKARAEAELAAAREKLAASLNDQDAYKDAFINIGRLESLLSMYSVRLASLAGVVSETKGPATKALKKVAEKAIEPEAVTNKDDFAALVCTLKGAAESLRPEPSTPFLRDLDPENEAARAVADLVPAELRPGVALPPEKPDVREVPALNPLIGVGYGRNYAPTSPVLVPPNAAEESTITHH